jgi:hypothetical protein
MLRKIAIMATAAALTACGGESDKSDKSPEVITLDTDTYAYTAVKLGGDEWQKIEAGTTELAIPQLGEQVTVVNVCNISSREYQVSIDVRTADSGYSPESVYCRPEILEEKKITYSADVRFTIQTIDLEDSFQVSYSGEQNIRMANTDEPRMLVALAYDQEAKKAYFYKRDGLTFTDGDDFYIDFLSSEYAAEVTYTTVPRTNGFNHNLVYQIKDHDIHMSLNIFSEEGYPHINIPDSMRTPNDFFRVNWQFGGDSSYNRLLATPDTALELSEVPTAVKYKDAELSQDGSTISMDYTNWITDEIGLQSTQFEFWGFESTSGVRYSYSYYIEPQAGSKSVTAKLLDINDLPGLNMDIPSPDSGMPDSWYTLFDNGLDYGRGYKYLLMAHENDMK